MALSASRPKAQESEVALRRRRSILPLSKHIRSLFHLYNQSSLARKKTDLSASLSPSKPLTTPVKLGAAETLKVILTTQEGKSAKRPHQAFLLLQDPSKKLDVSYPFSVKESGKAKVELVGL